MFKRDHLYLKALLCGQKWFIIAQIAQAKMSPPLKNVDHKRDESTFYARDGVKPIYGEVLEIKLKTNIKSLMR